MSFRDAITAGLLGLAGLMAAIGIAVAANSVTGGDLGLSAEPVSLATGGQVKPAPAPGAKRARDDRAEVGDDDGGEPTTSVEDGGGADGGAGNSGPGGGDDRSGGGGDSPNSGPGKAPQAVDDGGTDDSGKGSDSSGSGSGSSGSGSGSSGSGSSGSGDTSDDD